MSVQELLTQWAATWDEWYAVDRRKAELNEQLVEIKTKLQALGTMPSQPDPPAPVVE